MNTGAVQAKRKDFERLGKQIYDERLKKILELSSTAPCVTYVLNVVNDLNEPKIGKK
jgi:hypothetical protein